VVRTPTQKVQRVDSPCTKCNYSGLWMRWLCLYICYVSNMVEWIALKFWLLEFHDYESVFDNIWRAKQFFYATVQIMYLFETCISAGIFNLMSRLKHVKMLAFYFFWLLSVVSSLACLNLLGNKGFIVVCCCWKYLFISSFSYPLKTLVHLLVSGYSWINLNQRVPQDLWRNLIR